MCFSLLHWVYSHNTESLWQLLVLGVFHNETKKNLSMCISPSPHKEIFIKFYTKILKLQNLNDTTGPYWSAEPVPSFD